ncbi:MAG: hypothetical protein AUH83_13415 [Deltaproteobacteria bacterium 13_1_40CM_4_68_19]|nr:MAG: hypothetical protein AUH83_13415 [Deltaproteobacteria bacterium 13_1_40CM_4_68_19]OLD08276.1 MAG: hypothetical protein AUI90_07430 [Deltaproteobacteria bacterium 13_1_40CM_3_69_14]
MIVALAVAAAATLQEASPLALDVRVDPEEVTLGEHIAVRIAVEHDAREVYALPVFDPAPLAVPPGAPQPKSRREELGSGKARTVFELTLADYGTLEPRLPDLLLEVSGADGPRRFRISGRPLKFRSLVQEEGQGSAERAHHGPKPPVPVMVRSFLWVWLLGGLAVAVALFFWRKRLARLWRGREGDTTSEPFFDDLALERLWALRTEAPWTRGRGRAAIFELSEIVRAYLGARLQFNALDLTSEEFVAELHRRRLIGLDLAALIEEVRWEDLVKFAKLEPTAEECLGGIDIAESLIRHTRPLRAIAGKAA